MARDGPILLRSNRLTARGNDLAVGLDLLSTSIGLASLLLEFLEAFGDKQKWICVRAWAVG